MPQSTSAAATADPVRSCPFCGSVALLTASRRTASQDTYVRCRDCGEVWNPARPPRERPWSATAGTVTNRDVDLREAPGSWRPRLK